MNKIAVTTSSGFSCEVSKNALDNMELVDALSEVQRDNPLAISRVCRLLFDDETKASLYEHIRDDEGRVPVKRFSKEITEIFKALGKQGKN